MPERRILLAVLGRPHGVRGQLRVTSYADDLLAYGPLSDADGRRFVLRWRGEGVAEIAELVRGAEVKVADRSAAEKLTNTRLYVDRAQLPEPQDDEFYLADLIGLAACGSDGARLGTISAVHDYGAGASLEIEREGAQSLLVPFTRACVPEVNIVVGNIVVDLPDEVSGPILPLPLREGVGGSGLGQLHPIPSRKGRGTTLP
ncbi:MAG TPA: ribosome maturation factor RimM [Acetobacteraceae bacterium]